MTPKEMLVRGFQELCRQLADDAQFMLPQPLFGEEDTEVQQLPQMWFCFYQAISGMYAPVSGKASEKHVQFYLSVLNLFLHVDSHRWAKAAAGLDFIVSINSPLLAQFLHVFEVLGVGTEEWLYSLYIVFKIRKNKEAPLKDALNFEFVLAALFVGSQQAKAYDRVATKVSETEMSEELSYWAEEFECPRICQLAGVLQEQWEDSCKEMTEVALEKDSTLTGAEIFAKDWCKFSDHAMEWVCDAFAPKVDKSRPLTPVWRDREELRMCHLNNLKNQPNPFAIQPDLHWNSDLFARRFCRLAYGTSMLESPPPEILEVAYNFHAGFHECDGISDETITLALLYAYKFACSGDLKDESISGHIAMAVCLYFASTLQYDIDYTPKTFADVARIKVPGFVKVKERLVKVTKGDIHVTCEEWTAWQGEGIEEALTNPKQTRSKEGAAQAEEELDLFLQDVDSGTEADVDTIEDDRDDEEETGESIESGHPEESSVPFTPLFSNFPQDSTLSPATTAVPEIIVNGPELSQGGSTVESPVNVQTSGRPDLVPSPTEGCFKFEEKKAADENCISTPKRPALTSILAVRGDHLSDSLTCTVSVQEVAGKFGGSIFRRHNSVQFRRASFESPVHLRAGHQKAASYSCPDFSAHDKRSKGFRVGRLKVSQLFSFFEPRR
ncbi:hypothetical protein SAICODRAFT_9730 [Saitoella complicata NRRL Y-17804]|uniref:uncharacterized protein n=1 Tax=Saitoella complicata (strain BCRC 22490 / CBS 7301 / JCM 7358 / NBRC 10748 / NRRL Y-17804) TaxID=698492 RepID=UPI00086742C6|nr:uncharacterized protein SAICODRAFT_9730 [Saitoella complicata NRRL Y-17804]ODQ50769.1 hypothetical protein SAICODRAFT_9730 [Saitoella complicata NRRL Y-17804]